MWLISSTPCACRPRQRAAPRWHSATSALVQCTAIRTRSTPSPAARRRPAAVPQPGAMNTPTGYGADVPVPPRPSRRRPTAPTRLATRKRASRCRAPPPPPAPRRPQPPWHRRPPVPASTGVGPRAVRPAASDRAPPPPATAPAPEQPPPRAQANAQPQARTRAQACLEPGSTSGPDTASGTGPGRSGPGVPVTTGPPARTPGRSHREHHRRGRRQGLAGGHRRRRDDLQVPRIARQPGPRRRDLLPRRGQAVDDPARGHHVPGSTATHLLGGLCDQPTHLPGIETCGANTHHRPERRCGPGRAVVRQHFHRPGPGSWSR